MKKLVLAALAILLAVGTALALGWRQLQDATEVAVGYSAKQLCSGVFVAGLPDSFVIDTDIRPRMAILGPALPLLRLQVDTAGLTASASLLMSRAVATVSGDRGCILNALDPAPAAYEPGLQPNAPAVAGEPALQAALDAAFAEPEGAGRNTLAGVVSRGGEMLAERYRAPVTATTPLQGWSMNKSLTTTWVGMQVAKGRLDLALPVRQALSGYGAPADLLAQIDAGLTLGQLLQMESGFDFDENYAPGHDATRMLYRSPAMWRVAPATGHRHPPGSHFSYSSGDTNLAAYLWQKSLDGEPYPRWLAREFTGPLGLQAMVAEADASGVQVGSSYTYMTARDWLRVGQFWLDAWHDRDALLPDGWQRESTRPRASDPLGRYGGGFWLNTAGVAFPGLPEALFYASGNADQAVVVLPQQELVVVRLGLTDTGVDSGLHQLLLDIASAESGDGQHGGSAHLNGATLDPNRLQ